jgi:cell division protein FtsI/penicillin-binding protein 2
MQKRPIVKKKTTNKDSMQTLFTRFMFVVAFFILWIGGITVRLVNLQINQHEWLSERAQNQRRDQIKSKMLRGTIFDRSERALAMSVKVKSLYADPTEIEDVEATANKLAEVLKISKKEILETLADGKEKNRRFVWIGRKIDEDKVLEINEKLEDKELKKYDLPRFAGLYWKEEQKRSYPYKSLAAHIVGFSNSDDVGQAGIEKSKEGILKGEVVKSWQERDRLGRVYDESEIERELPKDIVLTISNSIQYKTEQALEKGVKSSNAKSGMAIVLDPKTGEILAMANYPTFDPNKFNESEPESWKNKAIQDVYSPGSVFKAIPYSGALEEKLITPTGEIDGRKGYIEVGGRRFNDPHATKIMSYSEALAISSNYAAIKTALGLGKDRFYNYAHKFGFGEATGIELPAETGGVLRPTEKWNGDSLASMAIGYEVSVTALQSASAYGAIANNGVRVQPHIIKEIRQADGKVISTTEPEKTQVLSADTSRDLRGMLSRVVEKGTAKRAQLNGYTSAGKTGTAWKYDPAIRRYNPAKYVSSFVGFAPVDNPSVVIAVVMDEPRGGARDGGQVSAPVFREIAEQILPEMSVVPDGAISPQVLPNEDVPDTIDGDAFEPEDVEIKPLDIEELKVFKEEENEVKANENIAEKPKPREPDKKNTDKVIKPKDSDKKVKESNKKEKPPEKKTPPEEKPKADKKKSKDERSKPKT